MGCSPIATADELREELAEVERDLSRALSAGLACECSPECVEANTRNRRDRVELLRRHRDERVARIAELEGGR